MTSLQEDAPKTGGRKLPPPFVLRREQDGAYGFDATGRRTFRVSRGALDAVEAAEQQRDRANHLPAPLRALFDENGRPRYQLLDPLAVLRIPPAQNALAAPNRIYLELTRHCPAHCEACYNASGTHLPDELSTENWQALIDELADAGVFEFRFTGGEPTSHPAFLRLLDHALATGRYVSVGTCGLMSRPVLEGLAQRAVDEIILSYQGPADVHDAFTGVPGCHRRAVEVLRMLRSAGRIVRLNVTLTTRTFPTIEDVFALADAYGVTTINLIHARAMGRGRDHATCLTAEQNYCHNQHLATIRSRYRVRLMTDFDLLRPDDEQPARHPITERVTSCPAGREFAFVSPEGYVFPCGVAPVAHVSRMSEVERRLFLAGSVREQGFVDIWHASPTWIPYRDLRLCKPEDCRRCGFWGTKCYGTCPPAAFVATGTLSGRDPLCFRDLMGAEPEAP